MPGIEIRFNKVYREVFTTAKRYIDLWGGRGRGGSFFATSYSLFLITQPNYCRVYFIRAVFGDIRESLYREFKDRVQENPTIRESDFTFNDHEMRIVYKPTGNIIIGKGAKSDGSRTAKMKSIAGATHLIVEEADELGEPEFMQMDLSLRTIKSEKIQVLRIFNPPHKQHFIWQDYVLTEAETKGYFKATPKESSSVLSIQSTYHDNVINIQPSTIEKFESFKITKPEYYYTVIKGLISEGQRGRIFSGWQPITDEYFNELDALSQIGIDFGSATGGIVEEIIINNRIYLRQLNYGGMTIKEIGIKLCSLGIKDELCIADSAEPLSIAKLRRGWQAEELSAEELEKYPQMLQGFNVYGVAKPKGYRAYARGVMQDYEVFVTEGSKDLWNEYREHRWALDKNKNPTDEPEDGNDHLIDPSLYVLTSKGRYF